MNDIQWLTALTAVTAVWIAFQQFKTARHRLRLDLFERRLAVYEAAITLIQAAVHDASLKKERISTFLQDSRQAEFLFDQPLLGYLEALRTEAFRFSFLNEQLHERRVPDGPDRVQVVNEVTELLNWFMAQAQGAASAQFRPYLSFRDVR